MEVLLSLCKSVKKVSNKEDPKEKMSLTLRVATLPTTASTVDVELTNQVVNPSKACNKKLKDKCLDSPTQLHPQSSIRNKRKYDELSDDTARADDLGDNKDASLEKEPPTQSTIYLLMDEDKQYFDMWRSAIKTCKTELLKD